MERHPERCQEVFVRDKGGDGPREPGHGEYKAPGLEMTLDI